jgi:prepilin-type processing-associated H-X9-DG protein
LVFGVLAALLFPALSGARRSAQRAESVANLRQLGSALHLFLNDYEQQIPAWTTVLTDRAEEKVNNRDRFFFWLLLPYLSSAEQVTTADRDRAASKVFEKLRSPGVPADYGFPIPDGNGGVSHTVQFAVNKSLDASANPGPRGNGLGRPTRMTDIRNPARTVWLAVGVATFFETSGQTPGFELPPTSRIPGPDERIWFPYSTETNLLFLDGHVESRAAPLDPGILNPWLAE